MTPEGRIVSLADRIAYVCHDIDDAERAGLLSEDDLPQDACGTLGHSSSERISSMVHDVIRTSELQGDIAMSHHVYESLMQLRSFLYANLYHQGDVETEEPKAERVVEQLFEYFLFHPSDVPDEYRRHDDPLDVQVADYLASMTDRYAIRVFEDLNVPRAWGLRRG